MYVLILIANLASYTPVTFQTEELCETARSRAVIAGVSLAHAFCVRVK